MEKISSIKQLKEWIESQLRFLYKQQKRKDITQDQESRIGFKIEYLESIKERLK